MFLSFLTTLAFAEPQDIPSNDTDSNETEQSNEDANNDSETTNDSAQEKNGNTEKNVEELTEEEYQQLMEEALKEILGFEDEQTVEYDDNYEEDYYYGDGSENGYHGNLNYAYVIRLWNQDDNGTVLHSARFAGDPQYMWSKNGKFGPLLGLRFQMDASESLTHRVQDHLIGLTTGLQMGPVRLNTAGSYFVNHLFQQENPTQTGGTVSYDFVELKKSAGVLWENTLTVAPQYKDNAFQATFALPFQTSGDREMGELMESFKVSGLLTFSFWQLGYELHQYPNNQVHSIIIGSGLLL